MSLEAIKTVSYIRWFFVLGLFVVGGIVGTALTMGSIAADAVRAFAPISLAVKASLILLMIAIAGVVAVKLTNMWLKALIIVPCVVGVVIIAIEPVYYATKTTQSVDGELEPFQSPFSRLWGVKTGAGKVYLTPLYPKMGRDEIGNLLACDKSGNAVAYIGSDGQRYTFPSGSDVRVSAPFYMVDQLAYRPPDWDKPVVEMKMPALKECPPYYVAIRNFKGPGNAILNHDFKPIYEGECLDLEKLAGAIYKLKFRSGSQLVKIEGDTVTEIGEQQDRESKWMKETAGYRFGALLLTDDYELVGKITNVLRSPETYVVKIGDRFNVSVDGKFCFPEHFEYLRIDSSGAGIFLAAVRENGKDVTYLRSKDGSISRKE